MKKEHKEKLAKARKEAQPKLIMKLRGYTINSDGDNFTTSKNNRNYYFATLEDAIYDISKDLSQKPA